MKTTIGVYPTHQEAVEAVSALHAAGFAKKQVSILGKVQHQDGVPAGETEVSQEKMARVAGAEVGISALAGSTLGLLTGIGVFAIPGLGFLFGAGALVGAIAGFDIGLIGGGIISALTLPNLEPDVAKQYDEDIRGGRFLVIVQGNQEEVDHARDLLSEHGKHSSLHMH